MTPIDKALIDLHYSAIPREAIQMVFGTKRKNRSIDHEITYRCIRTKIIPDCDIVGGQKMTVPLNSCEIRYKDDDGMIVFVPYNLTKRLEIISPMTIYNTMEINIAKQTSLSGGILGSAQKVFDGHKDRGLEITARLSLIDNNTVKVEDFLHRHEEMVMEVLVSNDPNLLNLQPKARMHFSELVELGVKAYMHNDLVMRVERGEIYRGHSLDAINVWINENKEAHKEYKEYLNTTWAKVLYMNDSENMSDFIDQMIPNNY